MSSDRAPQSELQVYITTYNCGRTLPQPEIFAPHLFDALSDTTDLPDLVVFCLQELAPISYAFLGGSFLTPYFNSFQTIVRLAAKGTSYVNIVARNVGLTGVTVFVREDHAHNISLLQTGAVGLGIGEMGNKGAVGVRLGYHNGDETTQLTFVSAHLAPMEDALERRNEDYQNIARRLVFVSEKSGTSGAEEEDAPLLQGTMEDDLSTAGGIYSPHSHLFFAGDLNYRTSLLKPSPHDVKDFPQPVKDESDPRHFSHLLAEDQLSQQIKAGRTLHGLIEVPITFPPTYKYEQDPQRPVILDGGGSWNWATHRWPSWCDRIFYSSAESSKITPGPYQALPLFQTSDHRPVALFLSVPLKTITDAHEGRSVPFKIESDWKSRRDAARRKEMVVGLMAYLALTWEGNSMLLATIFGAVGGWFILRSMLLA